MQKEISSLTWGLDLKKKLDFKIQTIGDDFILFDDVKILPAFHHPFRTDVTTFIISMQGETRGKIGLHSYHTVAPCMITLLTGEILQYESISSDFEGLIIVMSMRLTENLFPNIRDEIPLFHSVRENPSIPLDEMKLTLLKTYYYMLKEVVGMIDNPHRIEIVKHFMIAFYYHSYSWLHTTISDVPAPDKQENLVRRFLNLAEKNYKFERQVGFYADKLCITPKYLSSLIKQNTGKPANEWLNDYVMLEAKTLLSSTKMSIKQIADELNFSDASSFGKYFKRIEKLSPKEYKITIKKKESKNYY